MTRPNEMPYTFWIVSGHFCWQLAKFGPKYHNCHKAATYWLHLGSNFLHLLGLTDYWLLVVAGDIMEPDPIVVEVVQNTKTEFISFPVIWLRAWWSSSSSVWPVDPVVAPARGPADLTSSDIAASPEVLLPLPGYQIGKLPLFGTVVNADGSHSVGSAKACTLTLSKRGAPNSPADQEVLATKSVVRSVVSTTWPTAAIKSVLPLSPLLLPSSPVVSPEEVIDEPAKLRRGLGQSQTQHKES